jgi:AraC-like DNA-binding protein
MRMALTRLPARLRRALRHFSRITGQWAVVSLLGAAPGPDDARPLPPPVHPVCREALRQVNDPPCAGQWQEHLDRIVAEQGTHSHVCPLGLQCSCIPIYLGSTPVGIAKLVMSASTSRQECASATATLALAVTLAAQECYAVVLRGAMTALGGRVDELAQLNGSGSPDGDSRTTPRTAAGATGHQGQTVVQRVIAYVHEHYQDPELSLPRVAAATDYHPKYLSHLFARTVGTGLRTYLGDLRVNQAARLLLGTQQPVKEIAQG